MNMQPPGPASARNSDIPSAPPAENMKSVKATWVSALATLLLVLIIIILMIFAWIELNPPVGEANIFDVVFPFLFLAFPIVGWLIVNRLPWFPLGWIYLAFPLVVGIGVTIDELTVSRAQVYSDSTVAILLMVGSCITFIGYWLLIGPGILLFPDGHVPNKYFRLGIWGLLALVLVWAIALALGTDVVCIAPFGESSGGCVDSVENPLGPLVPTVPVEVLNLSLDVIFLLTIGTSLTSVFVRYRGSTGDVRQQIKWVAWMAVAGLFSVLGVYVVQDVMGLITQDWGDLISFAPIAVGLPVTISVAIFKYHLYEIDRLISRTLSYSLLTGALLAIFIGSVAVLQRFLPAESPLAIVTSTLIIAALFNPLRIQIQRTIDRRFYRQKYDAEKILYTFATTVRDDVDLDSLTYDILRTVRNSMQPEFVSLWILESLGN